MALLTVTLNPALDRLSLVPDFTAGQVHRVAETHTFAGGKGINVARVYHTLGGNVTATGFLGGFVGQQIRQSLRQEGIRDAFVSLDTGETRVSTVIVDASTGEDTVLNEDGPRVSSDALDALLGRLRELLPYHQVVSFNGSLPPGVPSEAYTEMIRLSRESGLKTILDSSGEALERGLTAQPFLVKPNTHELAFLSAKGDGWGGSAQLLREQYGVEQAIVTSGARGAVLAVAGGLWEASPPPVSLRSAVGSGDSFLAAFLWASEEKWESPDALKLGIAAGAANAAVYGSGFCSREQIFDLAAQTIVTPLG